MSLRSQPTVPLSECHRPGTGKQIPEWSVQSLYGGGKERLGYGEFVPENKGIEVGVR